MKDIIHTLYGIFTIFLCIYCTQNHSKLPIDFSYANELSEKNPDSLANILEDFNPSDLNGKDKADYWYLLTQVHQRQKRSLINDSLINFSVRYYKDTGSPYLWNAYRLAGLQAYTPTTNYSKLEELLKRSLSLVEANNDTINIITTCFNLADIYFFEQNHSQSIPLFKE